MEKILTAGAFWTFGAQAEKNGLFRVITAGLATPDGYAVAPWVDPSQREGTLEALKAASVPETIDGNRMGDWGRLASDVAIQETEPRPVRTTITMGQYQDAEEFYYGYCAACVALHECIEPDLENAKCEECGEHKVHGTMWWIMSGRVV